MEKVAAEHETDVAIVALAWVHKPGISLTIIGDVQANGLKATKAAKV